MRAIISAVTATAALMLLVPQIEPAQATVKTARDAAAPAASAHRPTDTSAARRRHKSSYNAPAASAAPPKPIWTGPDPTKGPGIEHLHELQRQGVCVIDEGYGRYTFCSNM